MTEDHAKNLYRDFQTQGHKGVCNTCHCVRTCIAHFSDLTNECFNCCIQRLAREDEAKAKEEERVRKCEQFLKDFAKL